MPENQPAAKTHFEELDPEVQDFLVKLKPKDLALLKRGMSLVRDVSTTGRVMRWVFIAMGGAVLAIAAFGRALLEIFHWFGGKG